MTTPFRSVSEDVGKTIRRLKLEFRYLFQKNTILTLANDSKDIKKLNFKYSLIFRRLFQVIIFVTFENIFDITKK